MIRFTTLLLFVCQLGLAIPLEIPNIATYFPKNPREEKWGFKELQSLIEKEQLRTIEDLLPRLPADLRTHYVLMETSLSNQKATLQNPRAILFDEWANFIIAFNGDSSLQGHDRLETIEYNEETEEYEFREIVYRANGLRPEYSDVNPSQCLGCHKHTPRPNWDPYPFWEGSFNLTDRLTPEAEKKLRDFMAKTESHPRYGHLLAAQNIEEMKKETLQITHEFSLEVNISQQADKRLAGWTMKTPGYDRYKFLILAGLIDCDNIYEEATLGGKATWTDLRDKVVKSYSKVLEPHKRLLDNTETNIATNLRYLFETRDIDISTWSHPFKHLYLMTTVASSGILGIAWELVSRDAELEKVAPDYSVLIRHLSRTNFVSLYTDDDRKHMAGVCANLKSASRARLGNVAENLGL